jgi:hypothetical protein
LINKATSSFHFRFGVYGPVCRNPIGPVSVNPTATAALCREAPAETLAAPASLIKDRLQFRAPTCAIRHNNLKRTLRILRMKLTHVVLFPALLGALAAAPAFAALGGDVSSVQADLAHMKGAIRVTTNAAVTVHEISTAYGTSVREFAGADGKVFAVSWSGPVNPDLRQVLGSYYPQFALAAASAPHGNHRHLSIEQPGLVVQNHGRLRAFAGRAWVPSMLPANFSVDDIQ